MKTTVQGSHHGLKALSSASSASFVEDAVPVVSEIPVTGITKVTLKRKLSSDMDVGGRVKARKTHNLSAAYPAPSKYERTEPEDDLAYHFEDVDYTLARDMAVTGDVTVARVWGEILGQIAWGDNEDDELEASQASEMEDDNDPPDSEDFEDEESEEYHEY